ncbi:MAG TPA: CAP domain-containing protein [Solirubrobacterales bacterium]|nr:CAP domain-containing protein [Solirubrobacterales bacterium]
MRTALVSILLATCFAALPAGAAAAPPLFAAASSCPGEVATDAPPAAQERAMLCLTNAARHAAGRRELVPAKPLWRAAAHKSADILGCDEFSHEACGRDFTYWIQRFGSCGAAAENIAWGTGPLGTVQAIFRAWMHSPGHRENILGPYTQIGIALRVGDLEGNSGAHVWTQDFGRGC